MFLDIKVQHSVCECLSLFPSVWLGYGLTAPCLLYVRNTNAEGWATLRARHRIIKSDVSSMSCSLLCMSLEWRDSFQNISNLISWSKYLSTDCCIHFCYVFLFCQGEIHLVCSKTTLLQKMCLTSLEDQSINFQTVLFIQTWKHHNHISSYM